MANKTAPLDGKSICEIIKSCGENHVKKFILKDMVIDFCNRDDCESGEVSVPVYKESLRREIPEEEKEELTEEEQLLIEDPSEYESKFVLGEYSDATIEHRGIE